jgi:hypothetical protein
VVIKYSSQAVGDTKMMFDYGASWPTNEVMRPDGSIVRRVVRHAARR